MASNLSPSEKEEVKVKRKSGRAEQMKMADIEALTSSGHRALHEGRPQQALSCFRDALKAAAQVRYRCSISSVRGIPDTTFPIILSAAGLAVPLILGLPTWRLGDHRKVWTSCRGLSQVQRPNASLTSSSTWPWPIMLWGRTKRLPLTFCELPSCTGRREKAAVRGTPAWR